MLESFHNKKNDVIGALRELLQSVILWGGELIGYLGRAEKDLLSFLPADEPERGKAATALAGALSALVETGRRKTLLIGKIDGAEVSASPLAPALDAAGFTGTSKGLFKRVALRQRP